MKILHKYLATILVKNFLLGLTAFTFLFLTCDFFDRIDNIMGEKTTVITVLSYFAYKLPRMMQLMLPVATVFAVLFTFGILSKNSEITAMRASGASIAWLGRPLFVFACVLTCLTFILSEFVVPFSERRQKELYNIDIKQKDKRGGYSQSDFWWRNGDTFYSIDNFDSRNNSLLGLSYFDFNQSWEIAKRTDAEEARWVDPSLGWSMKGVRNYKFLGDDIETSSTTSLPLPIKEEPRDFYEYRSDPDLMSYIELRSFIQQQASNGLPTAQYLADLQSKLAFPFIIIIVAFVVLPFSLRPARSGSMALSSLAALTISFMYYAVNSFSLAMGRAEIMPAFLAAWTANVVMGTIALVFMLGAESPS